MRLWALSIKIWLIIFIFFYKQHNYGKNEEFLLFASVHEATMMEKRVSDKPVTIELSIGNAGNSLDGSSCYRPSSDEDSDDESGK